MKFLTTAEVELVDRKLKLKVTAIAPTNALRFSLYDLGQDETLEGRIKMSEYILTNCVTKIAIGAKEFEPARMLTADLTDEDTSTVYFRIVDLVVSHQLSLSEGEEKKSS